jgi:hypothetical protein
LQWDNKDKDFSGAIFLNRAITYPRLLNYEYFLLLIPILPLVKLKVHVSTPKDGLRCLISSSSHMAYLLFSCLSTINFLFIFWGKVPDLICWDLLDLGSWLRTLETKRLLVDLYCKKYYRKFQLDRSLNLYQIKSTRNGNCMENK